VTGTELRRERSAREIEQDAVEKVNRSPSAGVRALGWSRFDKGTKPGRKVWGYCQVHRKPKGGADRGSAQTRARRRVLAEETKTGRGWVQDT
jgi:hypothetical protein